MILKKINLFTVTMLTVFSTTFGQVRIVNSAANNAIGSMSAFIDASSDPSLNSTDNIGKGLIYPRVNLTTFSAFVASAQIGRATSFPTYFDGMVVYNTGTGNTLPSASTNIVAVTPGFWYYSNNSGTLLGGTWTPLGSTSVKNIGATETATSTSIDGKQVYALKGTFTALGVNALISITKPTDMTGYYKMTTYIGGKTFRSEISSLTVKLDPLVTTVEVVTGNGLFSEVYPVGTYTYTLEYFKS